MPWPRSASFVPSVEASSSSSSARACAGGTLIGSLGQREEVRPRARVERSRSGRISVRISPRFVSTFVESVRYGRPASRAVRLRLLPPDGEQRPDDAVLALRLDPARPAARDEAVEDGLDVVGGRVTGGAQPVGCVRVADVAQLGLRLRRRRVDDLGTEHVATEAGVDVGLLAAQSVVHMQGRDHVAELLKHVPEARRVGPAGDEARDLASGRDQLMPADVRFYACAKVHTTIVTAAARSGLRPSRPARPCTSCPGSAVS